MKIIDPIAVKLKEPKTTIIFSSRQLQGTRDVQEDYVLHFNDECFAVADGLGGMPHGETAAGLAVETAVWAYKHVRNRPFYWDDKKLFMKRIFRSSNLRIWQKQKEDGFTDGMATTLLVMIVGKYNYWIGSAGDTSAWRVRNGSIKPLTQADRNERGSIIKALGLKRLGLIPQFVSERFLPNDIVILATDGITDVVSSDEIVSIVGKGDGSEQALSEKTASLLALAQEKGSTDNMTVCLVEKLSAE